MLTVDSAPARQATVTTEDPTRDPLDQTGAESVEDPTRDPLDQTGAESVECQPPWTREASGGCGSGVMPGAGAPAGCPPWTWYRRCAPILDPPNNLTLGPDPPNKTGAGTSVYVQIPGPTMRLAATVLMTRRSKLASAHLPVLTARLTTVVRRTGLATACLLIIYKHDECINIATAKTLRMTCVMGDYVCAYTWCRPGDSPGDRDCVCAWHRPSLNLTPRYTFINRKCIVTPCPAGTPVLRGFTCGCGDAREMVLGQVTG